MIVDFLIATVTAATAVTIAAVAAGYVLFGLDLRRPQPPAPARREIELFPLPNQRPQLPPGQKAERQGPDEYRGELPGPTDGPMDEVIYISPDPRKPRTQPAVVAAPEAVLTVPLETIEFQVAEVVVEDMTLAQLRRFAVTVGVSLRYPGSRRKRIKSDLLAAVKQAQEVG